MISSCNQRQVQNKIGLFLGVGPGAGGMFQYAQCVLEALTTLDQLRFTVTIVYSDIKWKPILLRYGLHGHFLRYGKFGLWIAKMSMVLRISAPISRWFGRFINPLVRELLLHKCNAWLFPGQEPLTYQMPGCVIGVIHDLMHRYEPKFPEVSSKFRFGIREHLFSNIARNTAAVLVDSNIGRKHVIESYGIDSSKIYILPYVAPSYIHESRELNNFNQVYVLPEKFLFYPAQFWAHKNHFRLLEAISSVLNECPDIALVLSGKRAHLSEQVQSYAEKLGLAGRIFFLGYVPDSDLRGLYLRARALIMPTFFGPTNMPPIEAMAVGCPVVISGIYGMPEQTGDAALYFNPSSVDEISHAISKIWQDDALVEDLILKGLSRSKAFNQNNFNQKIADILDKVCNQSPI